MSLESTGRALRAVLWSLTWGMGVGIGVALGGWLTVVGGAGAPGVESLDLVEDVLVLPVIAGVAVSMVHLVGQGLVTLVRSSRKVAGSTYGEHE